MLLFEEPALEKSLIFAVEKTVRDIKFHHLRDVVLMVDIFIKSFNRPFYLDRCLKSIKKFVSGSYKITVLDDGTPAIYLNKIRELFPEAEIRLSKQYQEKTHAIMQNLENGQEIDGFKIPTALWYSAVTEGSDYVLVLEEDVWFTQKVNLDEIASEMQKNEISLVKLGWLGNDSDDEHLRIYPISETLNQYVPRRLILGGKRFMDFLMYNKFKFFTILYKLKLVDNFTRRKYWALNSISMGVYRKEYWLAIWKDAEGRVDEKQQLRNAASWYHESNKPENFFARTKTEVLKTTFQSSATNSYHQSTGFDVNYFNHKLNEAWLQGNLDAMENFPGDFRLEYFDTFLDEKIDVHAFHLWVRHFKSHYENLGAKVD